MRMKRAISGAAGLSSTANVFLTPSNWKYLIFGASLVVMMRFRPEGIFPSSRIKEEMHEDEPPLDARPAGAS